MPNKISAYIDLAKLQGAHRMKIKGKDGQPKDCIVINLEAARAKPSEKHPERVHLSLAIVPYKLGKDDWGNTHFVCEPTTKEERESENPPKFPILGNGREFEDGPKARPAASRPAATTDDASGGLAEGMADDDIPF